MAVASASILTMGLAGHITRKGAIRLGYKIQQAGKTNQAIGDTFTSTARSFRKVENYLDDLEGIKRSYASNDELQLFQKTGRKVNRADSIVHRDGFNYRVDNPGVDEWTMRDAIQRRLVMQARRLPYEAPAFYLAQKAILDPMFGTNQDDKVNWNNPLDVIGDFSQETFKNLAFNVLPFEAGGTAAAHGYRNLAMKLSRNPTGSPVVESTRYLLEQVGANAVDLMNRTMRFSHQSIGAFSQMVDDAHANDVGIFEYMRQLGSDPRVASVGSKGATNHAKRAFAISRAATRNEDLRRSALDSLPGPFKGMSTAITKLKGNFDSAGTTYDDWQDVISGRKTMDSIKKVDDARYNRLRAFMERGGGTFIERYANDTFRQGGLGAFDKSGTKVDPNFRDSHFYTTRKEQVYKQQFLSSLSERTGLTHEAALKFVQNTHRLTPFTVDNSNEVLASTRGMISRIQFGTETFLGKREQWWDDLVSRAGAHDIKMVGKNGKPMSKQAFEEVVRTADMRFYSRDFQRNMEYQIAQQWKQISENTIPRQATSNIKMMAESYDRFRGDGLDRNSEFLLRRTAQRMGISTTSRTGLNLPLSGIKDELRGRGVDPTDLYSLRAFLMDKKDISKPWVKNGRNLFGFRPLSVGQAVENGYFSANDKGAQEQIKRFVQYRADNSVEAQIGTRNTTAYRMKVGGAFTTTDGTVIDMGRIGRGIRGAYDALASEGRIPILNFNPLQILGHHHRLGQRRSSSIKIMDTLSEQPMLRHGERAEEDFLLWLRQKSGKGNVFGIRSMGETRDYSGLYNAYPTNKRTMAGGVGRLYVGNTGLPEHREGVRGALDLARDQEGSVFFGQQSLLRRWREARRDSPASARNPHVLASRLAAGDISNFGSEAAEGMEGLVTMLRNIGFSRKTLREISEDPAFRDIFEPLGGQNLFDIPERALPNIARDLLTDDRKIFRTLGDRGSRIEANKLQQQLRNILRQSEEQVDFWNLETSDAAKSIGVSRRIDQFRSELSGYLVSSSQYRNMAKGRGSATGGIDQTITQLFGKVDDMFRSGRISGKEKGEARAAILSLQIENIRNKTYTNLMNTTGDVPYLELNQLTAEALRTGGPNVSAVLNEIASYHTGSRAGLRGIGERGFRRATAVTPYRDDMETSPFGSNFLLTPTMGTRTERSGLLNTMRGVSTTWSDPNAISTGTIAASHLSLRLNRYLESFGIGLEANSYRGPIDFYARGIIGKRVAPAFIGGSTFMALDRTLGGMVNEDQYGNNVYSPLMVGAAADVFAGGQIAAAGLVPGGQTADEKRDELLEGEVPIRQGRYWLLGNQPFKGGRIQYFRPSWYQRLQSGAAYAPEMNETPMERLLTGYDFSPLRPLDPYRREREDALSRPYPVSGDYFTGPWGALNPVLNSTVGRILKPRRELNPEANEWALSQYAPVGESGAYLAAGSNINPSALESAQRLGMINANYAQAGIGTSSSSVFYPSMGYTAPRGMASAEVRNRATSIAAMYSNKAQVPGAYVTLGESLVPYGVPVTQGQMTPRIIMAQEPRSPGAPGVQLRDFGYRLQETMGIYGFAAGNVRAALGFGDPDFASPRPIAEPASRGYSTSRAFWNLNIGGLGDFPLPMESKYSNFELSEIVRRFVPRDPSGVTYVNDLPNLMGQQYPWLPGADYPLASVKTGDPYTSVPDAEIRLPGTGYARTNILFPDEYGDIGLANIHDILGSVGPWSEQYDMADSLVDSAQLSPLARAKVNQTRAQVEAMRIKNEFTPYKYRYQNPIESAENPTESMLGRSWEWIAHRDTFFNTKFLPERTALEDWERENVYGATFPTWTSPYESYIQPFINKSTQRNMIGAISAGGTLGMLFGASARAKALGATTGAAAGGVASLFGTGYEAITGERYIPAERRKQVALEEYMDILKYTRANYNAARAAQIGDTALAQQFTKESRQTMYGADLNSTPEQVAMAVPERKREHFRAMLYAPEQEREQILSTAGRLERRLFQAAWGMQVEARPNLPEYFEEHELPPPESEFWNPLTSMDHIKIKTGNSIGLDMAQMGYYPQQIREANLVNPAYPDMFQDSSTSAVAARIRALLRQRGVNGDVVAIPNVFGEDRVELMAGVYG